MVLCILFAATRVLKCWSQFSLNNDKAAPFGKVHAIMIGGEDIIHNILVNILGQIKAGNVEDGMESKSYISESAASVVLLKRKMTDYNSDTGSKKMKKVVIKESSLQENATGLPINIGPPHRSKININLLISPDDFKKFMKIVSTLWHRGCVAAFLANCRLPDQPGAESNAKEREEKKEEETGIESSQ